MAKNNTVKSKPEGYTTISPYFVVKDISQMIEFTQKAFDAELIECIDMGNDMIMHAEVRIGDSVLMMGAAREESHQTSAMLYVYVDDTDASYQKALDAGASSVMPPADQFYGDRNAMVKDMAGNQWCLATKFEHVSPEELKKRAEEMVSKS
jgi:PhnB protein